MPFKSRESLLKYAEKSEANLGDLGLIYEENISGMAESELKLKMGEIVQIIQKSIYIGLEGTQYKDRILHQQSHLIKKAEKEGKIKPSVLNQIISNVTALSLHPILKKSRTICAV
jgi:L-serine dehydratase